MPSVTRSQELPQSVVSKATGAQECWGTNVSTHSPAPDSKAPIQTGANWATLLQVDSSPGIHRTPSKELETKKALFHLPSLFRSHSTLHAPSMNPTTIATATSPTRKASHSHPEATWYELQWLRPSRSNMVRLQWLKPSVATDAFELTVCSKHEVTAIWQKHWKSPLPPKFARRQIPSAVLLGKNVPQNFQGTCVEED